MISDKIKNLKIEYTNKQEGIQIGRDFIEPCLKECKVYRRNVGYFSSSALLTYISSLEHFIKDDVKIYLMCCPALDKTTISVLESMKDENERLKYIENESMNNFLLKAAGIKKENKGLGQNWKEKLLCYLIANNYLEIQVNIPLEWVKKNPISKKSQSLAELKESSRFSEEIISDRIANNLYHIKKGYFEFCDGHGIAFNGSANETDSAFKHNIDEVTVYKSWDGGNDAKRADKILKQIKDHWNNSPDTEKNLGFITLPGLSKEAMEFIKKKAPQTRPIRPDEDIDDEDVIDDEDEDMQKVNAYKYRHQDEAVQKFLEHKNGILEMATGTGKTRTAQKIITKLIEEGQIDRFIITMYGKDLLQQWYDIFIDLKNEPESKKLEDMKFQVLKDKTGSKEMRNDFILDSDKRGLIVSINDVHNVLEKLKDDQLSRTILIYDEVHNLGTDLKLDVLENLNQKVGFKLGLSATPNLGGFKKTQTQRLLKTVGQIIYEFGIEEAIQRGILCEFNYKFLEYVLTEEELNKKNELIGKSWGAQGAGNTGAEEALRNQIARIHKSAEDKLRAFENHLKDYPELLESTIIFTIEKKYAYQVAEIIMKYTNNFRNYFAKTDSSNLERFKRKEIDILITCDAVSQGIDIPDLNNIILFSADKGTEGRSRSVVQRLGRCLRNPSSSTKKIANVIDFIEIAQDGKASYDRGRVDWLTNLSRIENKDVK